MDFRIEVSNHSPWVRYRTSNGETEYYPPEMWDKVHRRIKHLGAAAALMVEATGTARDIVPLMIGEMLSYGKEELGWEETDAEEIRADALMGMGEMNDVAALVVRIAALVTDLIEDNEEITWDEWGFSSLPPSIRKDVVNRLLDLTPESAADVLRQLETILGRAGERLTEDLLPILDCTTRELLKKNS